MHQRTGIDVMERLHDSEEQFRLIAENLPGLCWISDAEGGLLWANREWHVMFDGTSAENGDPRGICHPDDLPVLHDLRRRMRALGMTEAVQLRLRGRDNIYRPYSSRVVPVRGDRGEVVRWCGVQIDLSEQHAHSRRQTVLRAFHDLSRDLTDAHAILEGLSRILSEHLGVPHLLFAELGDGEGRRPDVLHAAAGIRQPGSAQRHRLNEAFASICGLDTWFESRVIEDNRHLVRTPDNAVQRSAELLGTRAAIYVPIVKDGRPVAMIAVLDTVARHWTRDEVELCEELGERCWAAIARARAEAALQERERSQAFLIDWSDTVRGERSPEAIMATTLEWLARHLSVTRATYSESDETGRVFSILGEWRDPSVISIIDTCFSLDTVGSVVEREWMSGAIVQYDDVAADPRIEPEVAQAYAVPQILAFVSVPLIENGLVRSALSVQHDRPRPWRASEIQLLRDVAEHVWVMLERARAEAELVERERHQAFLIDWSDRIRGEASKHAIIATTLEWLGRHLGTARTTHGEFDAAGVFTVTDEWRGAEVPSILGNSFRLDQVGTPVGRQWQAGEMVRYDDVATDPRIEPGAAERYAAARIGAFVSIPLIQGGLMHSALSVQHDTPRHWRDDEIQLMRDIAERSWVALERAAVQATLEERERNQRFLLAWNDHIRRNGSARGILDHTLTALARHLGAMRTNFAETTLDGQDLIVLQEYSEGAASIVNQRYSPRDLGARLAAVHASGAPVRVDDIETDPRFDDQNRPLFRSLNIGSVLTLPMMRGGRIVAVLSVQHDHPHIWSDTEVELVRDLADRTLTVLESAHAEERLAENEALLSAFLENAPLSMHLRDERGRYLRVNPQFALALGRGQEELVGTHPDEILPPRIAAELERLEAIARSGSVASVEMSVDELHPDMHVLSMAFPITGAGAARTGGFALDLTERKRAEAALAKSREALYQTEKLSALGSLLAGVSHELNNPLSIVVAQAVMMERQARGGELAERAQKIRKAADRCSRIVQTFLAMARQKRPERAPVDLNAVAMAAYELAEYGLRNDGIAATHDLAPTLPMLSADSDQLHQIIINLIVNAQQALVEQGGPDRSLNLRTSPGDVPDTVILEVTDNGPGIPEDVRRRIFEPFYTTKPQGHGTGVGLSFSQGLAEAHGGRLDLVPTARGACFRLTLPVEATQSVADDPAEAGWGGVRPTRRALVIDDEREIAESLADFLSIEGFACDLAVGGEEAQGRLAKAGYDLIVSDLRMPGIDGVALHAWIAAERPELLTRIAFATGDTLGVAAARFLDQVKRPVLEKPFTPEAVRRFLQQLDLA